MQGRTLQLNGREISENAAGSILKTGFSKLDPLEYQSVSQKSLQANMFKERHWEFTEK